MYAVVCLGNPGKEYEFTRHNMGFLAGKTLINTHNFAKSGKKFKSTLYEGSINGKKIITLFPQTYMNLSGDAVQLFLNYYRVEPKHILVIYDDFDLPFGDIRIRLKGSGGTHNGMKDIIRKIATSDFPRIRIGIGPKPEYIKTEKFVLARFSKQEETILTDICDRTTQAIEFWVKEGIEKTMNLFNQRSNKEK